MKSYPNSTALVYVTGFENPVAPEPTEGLEKPQTQILPTGLESTATSDTNEPPPQTSLIAAAFVKLEENLRSEFTCAIGVGIQALASAILVSRPYRNIAPLVDDFIKALRTEKPLEEPWKIMSALCPTALKEWRREYSCSLPDALAEVFYFPVTSPNKIFSQESFALGVRRFGTNTAVERYSYRDVELISYDERLILNVSPLKSPFEPPSDSEELAALEDEWINLPPSQWSHRGVACYQVDTRPDWLPWGPAGGGFLGTSEMDMPSMWPSACCDLFSASRFDGKSLTILFPVRQKQKIWLRVKTNFLSRQTLSASIVLLARGDPELFTSTDRLIRMLGSFPALYWNLLLRFPGLFFRRLRGYPPLPKRELEAFNECSAVLLVEALVRFLPSIRKATLAMLERGWSYAAERHDILFATWIGGPKGRGVRARIDLQKGTEIAIYRGDLLGRHSGKIREQAFEAFEELGCSSYVFQLGSKWALDGSYEVASYARLVNHSRKFSNTCAKIRSCKICKSPELVYYTAKKVLTGEELLINYGETRIGVIKRNPWLLE